MHAIWDPGSLINKRENLLRSFKSKIHIHFYIWTELIFSWYWLSCNKIIVCRFIIIIFFCKPTGLGIKMCNIQVENYKEFLYQKS